MHLAKLAATTMPATLTAAKLALKSAGLKQTNAPALVALAQDIATVRAARAKRARARKTTIADRLAARKSRNVTSAFKRVVDQHAHGAWIVENTYNPETVGVTVREYYTGRKSGGFSEVGHDTTITVPQDWGIRVARRGIAVVDGIMTLDALLIAAANCLVYAVRVARRTTGKRVKVEDCYLATDGRVSYHGETADKAIAGLQRKHKGLALAARINASDLSSLVAHAPNATVSVRDAKATGACDYGIRNWCAIVGLDYDAGTTTLQAVYDAYERVPAEEARATIIRVLRRQRSLAEVNKNGLL